VEECTYFWGVNTSWGINTAESKGPLNQEDNQAPQPTDTRRDGKMVKRERWIWRVGGESEKQIGRERGRRGRERGRDKGRGGEQRKRERVIWC
jgi:hypothetical protein